MDFRLPNCSLRQRLLIAGCPTRRAPKLDQVIMRDLKRCAPYRIVRDNPDLYKIVNPLQLAFHFDQRP